MSTGCEVVIQSSSFIVPEVCASCEQPKALQVGTSYYQSTTRTTRTVQIPYCAACAAQRSAIYGRRRMLLLVAFLVAALVGVVPLLLPWLPMAVSVGVPTVLAIVAGIALRMAYGSGVVDPQAVWITGFSGARTTFYCRNANWGQRFALANQVAPTPRARQERYLHAGWLLAGFAAAGLSTVLAVLAAPSVHIDNATGSPITIWLDGQRLLDVQPQSGMKPRPTVSVPYGHHVFGWSSKGAKKPSETDEADVALAGVHLYNPGKLGCYWLEASAYGSASTKGVQSGPQSIAAFHTFKRVDNWFAGNPSSIRTKSSGETRVSLQPFKACEQLVEDDCSLSVRKKFVKCAATAYGADSEEDLQECFKKAASSCQR